MRGNINQVAKHGEVLALYASIEAVGAGESGRRFAELAEKIRIFSQTIERDNKRALAQRDLHPLSVIGCRRDELKLDLNRIDELSQSIYQLALEVTSSMHKEDVESQVVVYSKRFAEYLRELVAQIEGQKFDLDNSLAGERSLSLSIEQSCSRHLVSKRGIADSLSGGFEPKPAGP